LSMCLLRFSRSGVAIHVISGRALSTAIRNGAKKFMIIKSTGHRLCFFVHSKYLWQQETSLVKPLPLSKDFYHVRLIVCMELLQICSYGTSRKNNVTRFS